MEIDGWFIRSPQRKVVRGWRVEGGWDPPPASPCLCTLTLTPPPFPCRLRFTTQFGTNSWVFKLQAARVNVGKGGGVASGCTDVEVHH